MRKSKSRTFKVLNETKGSTLGLQVELADNFWTRLKGLLGKSELSMGAGLILKPCNSIHSFFMKFPFDAIFLNRDDQVVRVMENIKPGRIIMPVVNAVQVIELPAGTIKSTQTEGLDKITFC